METRERPEREVDLIELFWNILLGWRKIVCFGILFALLLGGMKYFMSVRSYRALQNINIEQAKGELKKEELEKLEDAKEMQTRVDDYEKYMETSVLMQIDPYAKPVVQLQYYVESDYIINYTKDSKRDYTNDVTSMYCNYISSGDMAQKVIEEAGLSVSKEGFTELIQVSQNVGTIYISISYADAGKLTDISNVVKSLLQQKSSEMQKLGSHTLEIVNESQNVVVDTALVERRDSIANSIVTLKSQLQNLKNGMSDEQTTIFKAELAEMNGEEEEEEEPGFSIKFVILGALVGIFLACAWIAVRMIFTARLQSPEEIRNMYGIRLLGEVTLPSQKKRFLPVIDKWILAIKNRKKKTISMEEQVELVSTNIALFCRQQDIDCVYITGSEYKSIDAAILKKIKESLSKHKINVKDGENIAYSASSLQSCIEVGNVLFIEQTGKSIYDEVYNEINLATEQKCNILGAVILNNK